MTITNQICLALLVSALTAMGCSASAGGTRPSKKLMNELKSIAILPVEVVHLGRLHDVTADSESQELGIAREGFILQRDLYRYFLREMSANEMDRTFLLDLRETNRLLTLLEEESTDKLELSVQEIAEWLGVEGIVTTSVDQLAPSRALLAGLVNGRLNTESNVKMTTSLRSKFGRIVWRYEDERPSNTDKVYAISKGLLKSASRDFFSKIDFPKPDKKKKGKNKEDRKKDKKRKRVKR